LTPASAACLFCRIAAGDEPAHLVLDEERFVAFLDIRPLFHGHVLLVPRAHHEALWDLPDELHGDLLSTARDLSVAVRDATGATGIFN
jgi:histidine triad (HIT) family protein